MEGNVKPETADVMDVVRDPFALVAWATVTILIVFLCLTHLGVQLVLLTSRAMLPLVVPVSFITSLVLVAWLGRKEPLRGKHRFWPSILAFVLTASAVGISAVFYDLSWDGQWYHQPAIYHLFEGWNPLTVPLGEFPEHNAQWIRHYAKGPWYGAVAMKAMTGCHEAGKFATWVALAAVWLSVTAAALDMGLRRGRAFALGIVAALNPVAVSEVLSFLVDGLMVCYLTCYTAALLTWIRRGRNPLVLCVVMAAGICSINSKFTGLIFLCFIAAGAGCYGLIKARRRLGPLIGCHLAVLALGVAVWGYNPYITNTIHRGQPFYPMLGSHDYPSLAAQGNDPLEQYETPPNMRGQPRLLRLAYAVFGRPSFAPYNNQREAEFMLPFAAHPRDLDVYRFHDTRIAGFGPWFSGILVLSLLLAGWVLVTVPSGRIFLVIGYLVVVASLLLSKHLWWARFGPQLWWLPLLPMAVVFMAAGNRHQIRLAWALMGLLLINTLMVATVRMHWEVKSTRKLQHQLAELREAGRPIEISMGYFSDSVAPRLRDWGIEFEEVYYIWPAESTELMSVARGNPGAVLYQFND